MIKNKATLEELFALFDKLDIAHETMNHVPIFTVEEGADIKSKIIGGHSKNLFLKDKNGKFFLICALGETIIKLNQVHKALECARLSFGSEEKLYEMLGVRPGSVTLFSLINDIEKQITLIIDKNIFNNEIINFHPLSNDATTSISTNNMMKFIKNWGGIAYIADFSDAMPIITLVE